MTDESQEDPTHRWTSETDRVRADGERITAGDAFDATAHERSVWPDRIEEIEEVADDDTCTEIIESGDREGEVCGRSLPCSYHSNDDEE